MITQHHNQADIASEILSSLGRIGARTTEHSRQVARLSGLSVRQFLYLQAVRDAGEQGEVTATMVARTCQLTAPTATRIADQLELASYIKRERSVKDRRKVYITLTDAGRQHLDNSPRQLHGEFLDRLRDLAPEERYSLLHSLERILEMMDANSMPRDGN